MPSRRRQRREARLKAEIKQHKYARKSATDGAVDAQRRANLAQTQLSTLHAEIRTLKAQVEAMRAFPVTDALGAQAIAFAQPVTHERAVYGSVEAELSYNFARALANSLKENPGLVRRYSTTDYPGQITTHIFELLILAPRDGWKVNADPLRLPARIYPPGYRPFGT